MTTFSEAVASAEGSASMASRRATDGESYAATAQARSVLALALAVKLAGDSVGQGLKAIADAIARS